jgi:hypothetical protein
MSAFPPIATKLRTSREVRFGSGQGADLEDCKAKFKVAWAAKCAGLTDRAIAKARELQLAGELESTPALGRPADSHGR